MQAATAFPQHDCILIDNANSPLRQRERGWKLVVQEDTPRSLNLHRLNITGIQNVRLLYLVHLHVT
jgi:hypothetical protein